MLVFMFRYVRKYCHVLPVVILVSKMSLKVIGCKLRESTLGESKLPNNIALHMLVFMFRYRKCCHVLPVVILVSKMILKLGENSEKAHSGSQIPQKTLLCTF